MTFSHRLAQWLRSVRSPIAASSHPLRRAAVMRLTALEDRLTPASVANVLADVPDPNSAAAHSETSTLRFNNSAGMPIVLVAFNDYTHEYDVGAEHRTGFARSTDGGFTFSEYTSVIDSSVLDMGDPALARDATTGTIYLESLARGLNVHLYTSSNDGASFSRLTDIYPSSLDGDWERPWITVDNYTGTGRGNVYVVAHHESNNVGDGLYFTRSIDGGADFSPPVQLTPNALNADGAFVIVSPDHSVRVFYYDDAAHAIMSVTSTDQGQNFTTNNPTLVVTTVSTGTSGDLGLTASNTDSTVFRSNIAPEVAVNPVTGQLYVAYHDVGLAAGDKADIFLTTSTDGQNWSLPIRVNTDSTTTDQWQPSLQVTPDGTKMAVGWYDRRLDPANDAQIDYFAKAAMIGSGGSLTWGSDLRVSDQSFPAYIISDPNHQALGYMGDYDGAVDAAGNGYFHFSWGDNRLAAPDVRTARVATTITGAEVIGTTPAGAVSQPVSSIDFTFDQAMDMTSFSVADDVVSFTRNGVAVPTPHLAYSWVNNTTLRITFDTQSDPGFYRLTIGPQILTAGGVPMDDNLSGVAGEVNAASDRASGTFLIPVEGGLNSPPPRVAETRINDGSNQRSRVTSLTVIFDTTVFLFPLNPADAFTLGRRNDTDPNVYDPVSFKVVINNSNGHTEVTLYDFTTPLNGVAVTDSGSLKDGHYKLTALASQITSQAVAGGRHLDGDGDGVEGGDYVLADNGQPDSLYRLFGDVDGSRRVDNADYFVLHQAFSRTEDDPLFLTAFDFDDNGVLDSADKREFDNRFLNTI